LEHRQHPVSVVVGVVERHLVVGAEVLFPQDLNGAEVGATIVRPQIDEATLELLTQIRQEQEGNKAILGLDRVGSGYVFCKPDGTCLNPERITRVFGEVVAALGLPEITFHGLRHTHATILLSMGIPPHVVSARLGHSGVSITLSTYAHVLPKQQGEAAQQFASYLETANKSNVTPLKRGKSSFGRRAVDERGNRESKVNACNVLLVSEGGLEHTLSTYWCVCPCIGLP
jgi:hypothetical protein